MQAGKPEMRADVAAELGEILDHYDIGELVDWERNERGYVNTSYAVETAANGERHKYFLRKYKRGIRERELEFEHSVISHLIEEGFELVAKVFQTRDGETYVRRGQGTDEVFYAVFDFLPGEDRYTWVNPACSDREVEKAAAVLARFHNAVVGFAPKGERDEPRIIELLPTIGKNVAKSAARNKRTAFDAFLLEHVRPIQGNVAYTLQALRAAGCGAVVPLVNHCDYHPGNLKFQNGEITGLFDFDWCKIDARCFDVALALFYFFAAWEESRDGAFDLDQTGLFLRAYQRTLEDSARLDPMGDVELECLPHMLDASNLYVLNWTIEDFYAKEVDPEEYLIYLRHGVRVMEWLGDEGNRAALSRVIASARA
jgi:homoserine kinase type II